MTTGAAPVGVIGRQDELAAIDRFVEAGPARALVLEGEPGIGKTTLWLAGVERARERGRRVLVSRPAAVETGLSLAGLGDLLDDVPRDRWDGLPETQRRALSVALAEEEVASSDSRTLGVALIALLRQLAAERPLLLAIDDLQWLDAPSAAILVFALRRLADADVRLLASCRGEHGAPLPFAIDQAFGGSSLARLGVVPLSEGAIRRLLHLRLGLSLSRRELHAVHGTAGGNPFYALELGLAGVVPDGDGSLRLPRSLRELVGARLRALPAPTRDALLFVAALADPSTHALDRAGLLEALEPALGAEVLELDEGRLRFVHPLLGSVAWAAAGEERHRAVHRAAADLVDTAEQRARHLALATEAPDAEVSGLLEAAARTAVGRGAPAAAADLLEHARRLTPGDDLARWARLSAEAARVHAEAGNWPRLAELAEEAQRRLPPGPDRAAILVTASEMRPELAALVRQAVAEAGETAVGVRARLALGEQAALAGQWAASVAEATGAAELARRLGDRALLGVALQYLAAAKLMDSQPSGRLELAEASALERELGGLPLPSVFHSPRTLDAVVRVWADDPVGARPLFERLVAAAGESGDDVSLLQLLSLELLLELRAGDWAAARSLSGKALDLAQVLGFEYGRAAVLGPLAILDAYEGDLEGGRRQAREALELLPALGDGFWSTHAESALLFVELHAGDAEAALAHADAIAARFPDRECWWSYHQADELAALVLARQYERALARVEALRLAGHELALPRFLVWAERGDGLVHAARGELAAAQAALERALAHHEDFALPFERARTLHALGHVLRRQKRRRLARATLGEALVELERLGARGLAAAVELELQHVGGRPPSRGPELTGAEHRVARLVAAGLSNKEVAAELFIAVSTVEASLTRVYGKLGITSRSQLARVLDGVGAGG